LNLGIFQFDLLKNVMNQIFANIFSHSSRPVLL
jgi:hypothetical protein